MSLQAKRKRWSDRCDYRVHGATVWMLRLSRVFCVAPVILEQRRNVYNVRVSHQYAVINCIVLSIMGVMALVNLLHNAYHGANTSKKTSQIVLSMIIAIPNLLLFLVIFIVSAFSGKKRMKCFMNHFKQIEKIDANIDNKYKTEGLEKRLSFKLVVASIASFMALVMRILFTIELIFIQNTLLAMFIHMYVCVEIVVSCFLALQIIFVVTSIAWSFKTLNERIRELHDGFLMNSPGKKMGHTAIVNSIQSIREIHASLIALCRQVNEMDGRMILILFCNYFFRILVAVYFYIIPSIDKDCQKIAPVVNSFVSHTLYVIVITLMLVEPCHRTHEEMKTTKALISKMLCCTGSARDRVSEALICFYKTTAYTDHVYAPYGMVKISRPFYSSFFGSLATFLIIVAQMKLY